MEVDVEGWLSLCVVERVLVLAGKRVAPDGGHFRLVQQHALLRSIIRPEGVEVSLQVCLVVP